MSPLLHYHMDFTKHENPSTIPESSSSANIQGSVCRYIVLADMKLDILRSSEGNLQNFASLILSAVLSRRISSDSPSRKRIKWDLVPTLTLE